MDETKKHLNDFFKIVSQGMSENKLKDPKEQELIEKIENAFKSKKAVKDDLENEIVAEDLSEDIKSIPIDYILKNIIMQEPQKENVDEQIDKLVLGTIQENYKSEDPLVPFDKKNYATLEDLQNHYTKFLSRIQQQMSSIGGGGEVNFRYLDDVNRATMTNSNDNWVLEYDSKTGKAQFTDVIGPIEIIKFNTEHDIETHEHEKGSMCWNEADQTLNLFHDGGVVQQVGQELFGYVRNNTGSTILNGTVVQFSGADQNNGRARLEVSPFLADGTYPSLYTLGIATQDIADTQDGRVTVWGKVREINASGSAVTPSEIWNIGDILYAHPSDIGKLTKYKPTAPSNVVPMAAVLSNDSVNGEIFVRPTIEQRYDYGTASSTQNQTVDNINEATPITFNVLQSHLGVSIDPVDSSKIVFSQSGLFALDFNVQALSNNSSSKDLYFWFSKNGSNIPYSTRIVSITGNNVYTTFHVSHNVSMQADDYVQFMWASTDTSVQLISAPATSFSPESPSVYLHIDQAAL